MTYKEMLFSPTDSLDHMSQTVPFPSRLYKYQSFVLAKDGSPNPYWSGNLEGQFHLSLGCEFEDSMDCRPSFHLDHVLGYIDELSKIDPISEQEQKKILDALKTVMTPEYFRGIQENYQRSIRIGCFTDSSDNVRMWNKYACHKTGFCIEYTTQKHPLFRLSTLPVLYENAPYDSSMTLAHFVILECVRQAKGRTMQENMSIYDSAYRKILKTAYIPLFVKEKKRWKFEREYRMFLLKTRTTREGKLESKDYLDSSFNLDLSHEITAVYLGQNFEKNPDSAQLLESVASICRRKGIPLYQKEPQHGKKANKLLL